MQANSEPVRICIIDTYVVLYNLLHRAQAAYGEIPEGIVAYAEAALEWVDSLVWFPALQKRGAIALWVEDCKPYWRSDYHPDYKALRMFKPSAFQQILDKFHAMEFRCLGQQGFEADDVAAAVVMLWRQRKIKAAQLFLATCDSDWQGLVCQPDVFWVDLNGNAPRVRQRQEIYNWLCSKWKKQSSFLRSVWEPPDPGAFVARQIWDWKRHTGDITDCLPPRSPLYLIDLFEPPEEYKMWQQLEFMETVDWTLDTERCATLSLDQAEQQMSMLGLLPPISPIAEFNPQLFRPVI